MRIIKDLQNRSVMVILLMITAIGLCAQTNYSDQIEAFKQSFKEKNSAKVKPFLSADLSFEMVPQDRLPQLLDGLLGQIFEMPVVSIEVKETREREVVLAYDFGEYEELGKRESSILFDEEGKILKIQMIDNLIKLTAERRREEGANAKPMPDELAKEYVARKIEIKTDRGYSVFGDLYEVGKDKPVILLCHQAGWNKYEYVDIAPKLNAMGFNCLAVDMTGGEDIEEHKNETIEDRGVVEDRDINVRLGYSESELTAAVEYLYERYNQPVTVWGSSYSATLVIYEAERNEHVNAFLSFSAFNHFREARPRLEDILPKIDKPMFMTSSRGEASIITGILKDLELKKGQYHFKPEGSGLHGSRALWNGQRHADEYWVAVRNFLNEVYDK